MELPANASAMVPRFLRVTGNRRELSDTWTLELDPEGPFPFKPGQFNMMYAFGIGEAPISISGDPAAPETLVHTIRAVGKVTEALCAARPGTQIGIRGPYGTDWPVAAAEGSDVVVLAGGIGLAPLRPALFHLMNNRSRYGRVSILYGGRSPETLLFPAEVKRLRSRFDVQVEVTVDAAPPSWRGNVGVVTTLVRRAAFDPENTTAFVCGPEIMMRFALVELGRAGVATDRTFVSMERNMKCAIGFCGHCQYGTEFICKDGPVFAYSKIEHLFRIREL
ncbi:MAG TPA: FAD/NAD(P)-binding protein [Blastocatellia bacterium]|nr:FAD/NAD(P)-binding protein [Blastocatellia bacterium]